MSSKIQLQINHTPIEDYKHQVHHHCESGAVSNLFSSYGLPLSEEMVFGIGAGLYFAHVTFLKTLGAPTTTFRFFPGQVFKMAAKTLGVQCTVRTYKDAEKGMNDLDALLAEQKPAGLFTNMLHLAYLPDIFKFEFSAHNIIVYGKEGDDYLISDSIIEFPVKISREALAKARFGKGFLGSKGRMYHVTDFNPKVSLEEAIRTGIRKMCKRMLRKVYPWGGLRGMRRLAKGIKKYPEKFSTEQVAFYLTNIVRMQEIVGTGGSGFRLIYARFLQEAATRLNSPALNELAGELKSIAMDWRNFALKAGKTAKTKGEAMTAGCAQLSDMLSEIADKEEQLYLKLLKTV